MSIREYDPFLVLTVRSDTLIEAHESKKFNIFLFIEAYIHTTLINSYFTFSHLSIQSFYRDFLFIIECTFP